MTTSAHTLPPVMHLDVLMYPEEGYWVGHCIQLDHVVSGRDKEQVYKDICTAISGQVQHALDTDNFENLFQPHDHELYMRMLRGRNSGQFLIGIVRKDADSGPGDACAADDDQDRQQAVVQVQYAEEPEKDLIPA
jgi:hypothetical protein